MYRRSTLIVAVVLGVASWSAARAHAQQQPGQYQYPTAAPVPGQPAPQQPYQQQPGYQPPPQQPQQPQQPVPPYQPPPQGYQPAPQPQPYPQPAPPPQGYQPAPQPPVQQPAPYGAPASEYGAQPGYPAPAPVPMPEEPAGPVPTLDGAVQLGLYLPVVRYLPVGLEFENGGAEVDVSRLDWGIAENPVSLEIGYGLTDSLVLGGQLGIGGESSTQEQMGFADQESSEFNFQFGPKLDYMFSAGSKVNPFAGAVVLVGIDSTDNNGAEFSTTVFRFLGRIGLRAFLADSFSIDPALVVGAGVGSASQDDGTNEADLSVTGFQVGLDIGFSGWMR